MVNLGVVSKLEKMDKLNVMYQIFYREQPGLFTYLSRRWRQDSPDKTMCAVEELIDQAMVTLENNNFPLKQSVKLFKYLYESENGLVNLRSTYKEKDDIDERATILIEIVRDLPTTFPTLFEEYLLKYGDHTLPTINENLACE